MGDPPPSTNETKIALRTGKRSILMSHNLMKKYGTVNSLGLVSQLILDEGQIYLGGGGPPPSTNETKIALCTGKRSILMSHNLMKKYGTVNSLGLV